MNKNIDIKTRLVHMYDVDTGRDEDEIVKYLDKQMKIVFHSIYLNGSNYTYIGKPSDQISNTIVVSGYKKRSAGDKVIIIE